MASNKAKLLEKSLEELHPFAARRSEVSSKEKAPQVAEAAHRTQQAVQSGPIETPSADPSTDPRIYSSNDRSIAPVQPRRTKRQTVRRAFEFYMDQLDSLETFSLEERLGGDEGNKSQMVREALDDYITRRWH